MKKIMFDIMNLLNKGLDWDVKEFSKELYKPYSVIQQEYKNLVCEGYLDENGLTEKAFSYLEEHKIDNALILAAGVSSRFVPICFEKPKPLLEVKGEILIERQIRQIKEAGIEHIVIVVGYMKEKFQYLKDKYGVTLIETDTYAVRNNHASVFAAKDFLGNTIVTSADLYFNNNIFEKYAYDAFYCSVYQEGDTEERGIQTDSDDRIVKTYYGARDSWVTLGYAYFNKRFSHNFIEILTKEYSNPNTRGKFWADIQDENLEKLYMYTKHVPNNVIYEFDSLEDLKEFDPDFLSDLDSELLNAIAESLHVGQNSLHHFYPLSKEDLGRGFTFICNQERYICRITLDLHIKDIRRYDESIQELVNLTESFTTFYDMSLPLCAAENVISSFVKIPLSMGFQERYIVGNTYSYDESDNFIGSNYLLPFYQMISDKCRDIFHAKYTDARTLTGMNCLMMVLTAVSKPGEKILILGSSAGGHASVRPIAERLGLIVDEVPFDFQAQDLNYAELNKRIADEAISYVLLAPSDIIHPFEVQKMNTEKATLLYDVSQMLGLIGAGIIRNPLDTIENSIIFGGTHKTFPGPASGLILTNNEELHSKLERTINPIYIRHTQMHQKVSLLFALIEFDVLGKAYEEHIVELSNCLAEKLIDYGFDIGRADGDKWSYTHQIFIYTDKEMMERIFENSKRFGITLNKKKKQLFRGFGIRLGLQEVARYGWPNESMNDVASIIYEISKEVTDDEKIENLLAALPAKKIQYVFDDSIIARFEGLL